MKQMKTLVRVSSTENAWMNENVRNEHSLIEYCWLKMAQKCTFSFQMKDFCH